MSDLPKSKERSKPLSVRFSETEKKDRAGRFKRGLGAVMDILTGRLFAVRRQNDKEAIECFIRDRSQQEALVQQQALEKRDLVERIGKLRAENRHQRRALIRQMLAWTKYTATERSRDDLQLGL